MFTRYVKVKRYEQTGRTDAQTYIEMGIQTDLPEETSLLTESSLHLSCNKLCQLLSALEVQIQILRPTDRKTNEQTNQQAERQAGGHRNTGRKTEPVEWREQQRDY